MRRMIAVGILVCFLMSVVPAMSTTSPSVNTPGQVEINPKIIDDSELTLKQIEALNSVGMARGTNTNWAFC